MQPLPTEGQQAGAASVGEEAEVADADGASGEQVQQEAAQELVDGQGQPRISAFQEHVLEKLHVLPRWPAEVLAWARRRNDDRLVRQSKRGSSLPARMGREVWHRI